MYNQGAEMENSEAVCCGRKVIVFLNKLHSGGSSTAGVCSASWENV